MTSLRLRDAFRLAVFLLALLFAIPAHPALGGLTGAASAYEGLSQMFNAGPHGEGWNPGEELAASLGGEKGRYIYMEAELAIGFYNPGGEAATLARAGSRVGGMTTRAGRDAAA